ncbi:hypothetical protein A616_16710 [Brevibacillus brevis X23]|nr:hypothetical protein A616_16710 [Brevibacillus brevis X23]
MDLKGEDMLTVVTVEDLIAKGFKVYSFSKLGTFNNCQYEYYNTYILKNKGIENCYTLLGSTIHNGIELIYSGEQNEDTFKNKYYNKLTELELLGINFPNDKIKASWVADVNHFYENFKKMDKKMLLEKHIIFEISDGIWMQGYIDSISPSELGKPYIDILDWKTSSKFTGKKLTEAGRQLLMYKVGLESTSNFKVNKVAWFMIKYIYVCSNGKSKVKKKMCNRGKWVKEMRDSLEKDLLKLQMETFEIELLLDKAVQDNNINCLPNEVRGKYWLEDCIVEYEITEERINEFKEYIIDTIKEIESKNIEEESEWIAVEIDSKNSFYCSVLCGHRKTCKYYKQYLDENANKFDKKTKKDGFDLFS